MPDAIALRAANAISQQRLMDRLAQLARFGALENGGVDRQALSEAELDARAWQIEHHGEEMGYVLEGEIELALGEQTYTLTAGD